MNNQDKISYIINEYARLAYLGDGENLGDKLKNKKVYLSGQITGNKNYKGLFMFAEKLVKFGNASEVFNPATRIPERLDYKSAMKRCVAGLVECRTIIMLPNAYMSKRANLEKKVALSCGLDVVTLSDNVITACAFNAVEEALKRLL